MADWAGVLAAEAGALLTCVRGLSLGHRRRILPKAEATRGAGKHLGGDLPDRHGERSYLGLQDHAAYDVGVRRRGDAGCGRAGIPTVGRLGGR